MDLHVLKAVLSSRDANLAELRKGKIERVPLSSVIPAKKTSEPESSSYESIQGPTITPKPLWAVEVKTFRRNVGESIQESPWISGELLGLQTSRIGKKVRGTGSEKAKWRSVSMDAPVEARYLFGIATSTWLLPFAIGHRTLACIPARIDFDKGGHLEVFHDLAKPGKASLREYADNTGGPSNAIRNWTRSCQEIWSKIKKSASYELVTERLDHHRTMSRLRPEKLRVIHTRSRLFYAALLVPTETTALGLPFDRVRLLTRHNGQPTSSTEQNIGGVIVDNKVHYVDVASEEEGHWLASLFNSKPFSDAVMERSTGEPPNIYSIPAQELADRGIRFDPSSSDHQALARLGRTLATKMSDRVREFYLEGKGLKLENLDDSVSSPEVPSLIMSAQFREFLQDTKEWQESNDIAEKIMSGKR